MGHFGRTASLDDTWRAGILEAIERSVPLLGICVGLQWLFEGSTEAPGIPGLGVMRGICSRLPDRTAEDGRESERLKVPHVGWNSLALPRATRLLAGVPEGAQVYFTHSYAAPLVSATAARHDLRCDVLGRRRGWTHRRRAVPPGEVRGCGASGAPKLVGELA